MPWFRVDDTFPHHAKVLAAGNAAIGLWVRAGSWSMQQLTDGHIPAHVARALGTPAEAKRLVGVGLWKVVEGGFQFHEWAERQPSKARVEAERDAATDRQRRARDRAKSQRDSHGDEHPPSRRESRRDNSVGHGPPDPTRPNVVTPVHQLTVVPAEAGMDGLTDETLTKIQIRLRCDRDHAQRVADKVLTRANVEVQDPARYVLAAIDRSPGDYRPTPGPLRKVDECPTHPGQPSTNCGGCVADSKAVDR